MCASRESGSNYPPPFRPNNDTNPAAMVAFRKGSRVYLVDLRPLCRELIGGALTHCDGNAGDAGLGKQTVCTWRKAVATWKDKYWEDVMGGKSPCLRWFCVCGLTSVCV